MSYRQELETAKKAALAAGQILIEQKNNLNKSIFSSNTDIKLEADLVAEKLIKVILNLILNIRIDFKHQNMQIIKSFLDLTSQITK